MAIKIKRCGFKRKSKVKKFVNIIAGSSNGRTPGFGPGYIGSNPISAAKVGSIEVTYVV